MVVLLSSGGLVIPTLDFDPLAEAHRNWTRHDWDAPDAMLAATSIARAHQIVVSAVDRALAPYGLSFARFEILALLHFSRRGALPMGKIGDRLQVHPTSVTSAVARLERDGLVRRAPSAQDRRTVLAELTPDGRATVIAAAQALAGVRFGLDGLESADLDAIREALAPIRRAAGDAVATP